MAFGVATAYGQLWLPSEIASLANSSGSWSLVAFVVALRARTPRIAALCGALALAGLLLGYVLGAGVRGDPSSRSLMVFWGLAALTAGPVLGVSAHWCARAGDRLVAVGAGVMSGVLVGEGAWALASVADTTYPPYWWAEIVVGLVLLATLTRGSPGGRSSSQAPSPQASRPPSPPCTAWTSWSSSERGCPRGAPGGGRRASVRRFGEDDVDARRGRCRPASRSSTMSETSGRSP
jgi:hypothetical protein